MLDSVKNLVKKPLKTIASVTVALGLTSCATDQFGYAPHRAPHDYSDAKLPPAGRSSYEDRVRQSYERRIQRDALNSQYRRQTAPQRMLDRAERQLESQLNREISRALRFP